MFFKQKSEIKHMYMMGVVVIKICAFIFCLMYYDPDNTIEVISSRSVSLLELFLGRRRPPKIKSTVYPLFLTQCKGRNGHILILRLTFTTIMWQSLGSNSCSLICSQMRCQLRYRVLPV